MSRDGISLATILRRVHGNHLVLLLALLVNLLIHPWLNSSLPIEPVLHVANLLLAIIALVSIWHRNVWVYVAVTLALIGESLFTAGQAMDQANLAIWGSGLRALFFVIVIVSIFGRLVKSTKVTMNTVFGACSVYLLIAMAWGSIYVLLETLHPGSFSTQAASSASWVETFGPMARDSELLYFSFIALSTVGFGDIIPLSPPARMLAAIEGLIGPLYLAVIIARMISLEVAHRNEDNR